MNKVKRNNCLFGYLFIAGPIVGFICFGLIPLVFSLIVSLFYEYSLLDPEITWAGLYNYTRAFSDPTFRKAMVNVLYLLLEMFGKIAVALLVALLVSLGLKGQSVFRAIFYLPVLCSSVAVSFVWKSFLDTETGILNAIITSVGLPKVGWLTDGNVVMWSMILQGIWAGIGGSMVMYIAALKNVPHDYYEAAKIDGANSFRVFFNITFPMISPTTFYLLTMGIIGHCEEFTRIQLMTDGGPGDASMVPVLYIYKVARTRDYFNYDYSYATAMAWIFGLLIILLVGICFKTNKYWVHYGD